MSNNVATVAKGSNIIVITVPTPTSSRFQHRLKVLAPHQVQATPQGSIWDNLYRRLPKGETNTVFTRKDKSQHQNLQSLHFPRSSKPATITENPQINNYY